MSTTSERKHPREDLLADLAADVLPVDLAARVEAHVAGCPRCAEVLAEADGIRDLLRGEPPPSIPDDVAARIGAALGELRFEDVLPADAAHSVPAFVPEVEPVRPAREEEDDAEVEARWAAAARAAAEEAARTTAEARRSRARQVGVERLAGGDPERVVPLSRLRRRSDEPVRQRRQALEEQRSDARAGLAGRIGSRLLIAAAVLGVIAAAGAGLRSAGLFGGEPQLGVASSSAEDSSAGAAAPESTAGAAPVLAPVTRSGVDYSDAALPAQAKQLVTDADTARAQARQEDSQPPAPLLSPPADGNTALETPAALAACLVELGVGGRQPVAVDLARYQGRDAAVIVLPVESGGYEVWVVARDCRPGADGTLDYAVVP